MMIERFDLGYWALTKPETPEAIMWERIPIILKHIDVPFGYAIDPEDDNWYIPIPKELELLELAKKHIKRYSYRDVSAWLTTQSGRYLSHVGLKTRIDSERKRKRLANIKRKYAQKLQETLNLITALETQRVGARKESTGTN
jgi:hypothetical protein